MYGLTTRGTDILSMPEFSGHIISLFFNRREAPDQVCAALLDTWESNGLLIEFSGRLVDRKEPNPIQHN